MKATSKGDLIDKCSNKNNNNNEMFEMKPQTNHHHQHATNVNQISYAHKRSILRKLMICQRKKFMLKKEQVEMNRLKNNLADTSVSNFSQADGFVGGPNNDMKENLKLNSENQNNNNNNENGGENDDLNQAENVK